VFGQFLQRWEVGLMDIFGFERFAGIFDHFSIFLDIVTFKDIYFGGSKLISVI
jgi:hypothetical protein